MGIFSLFVFSLFYVSEPRYLLNCHTILVLYINRLEGYLWSTGLFLGCYQIGECKQRELFSSIETVELYVYM